MAVFKGELAGRRSAIVCATSSSDGITHILAASPKVPSCWLCCLVLELKNQAAEPYREDMTPPSALSLSTSNPE